MGIAWLLLRRPEIWLLDEPYASVDSAGREFLENIIGDAAKAGATVILSSHDDLKLGKQKFRTITMAGGRVMSGS